MNLHEIAPPATAENLKDPAWRKRTGFDSLELTLDEPVAEAKP